MGIKEKALETWAKWKRAQRQILESEQRIKKNRSDWDALKNRYGKTEGWKSGDKILRNLETKLRLQKVLTIGVKQRAPELGGDAPPEGVGVVWFIPIGIMVAVAALATAAAHLWNTTINDTKRLAVIKEKLQLVKEGKASPDILKEPSKAPGLLGGIMGAALPVLLIFGGILILPEILRARRKE